MGGVGVGLRVRELVVVRRGLAVRVTAWWSNIWRGTWSWSWRSCADAGGGGASGQ